MPVVVRNIFENYVKERFDLEDCVAVNNGTSAIDLVYQSLDLKHGDEIIFPGYGYMAASNLALKYGYKPKFVDVDPNSLCIDVEKIEKQITKKTKMLNLSALQKKNLFYRLQKMVMEKELHTMILELQIEVERE